MPEQPPPHASACPQCQSRRTDTSADFPPHGDTIRETFDVLHRHWFPVVARWARRRCADLEDAEDVAQQVFADVCLHSRRYCDFTQPDIARFLGMPLGTVKSHRRRALRALAEVVPGSDTT